MVPVQTLEPILGTLRTIVSASVRDIAITVLWLVERRTNPNFRHGYVRGILEGCWGVVLIIATGEHGDRETPSITKRLTVTAMWMFGVVLIAQFTAAVTSSLTVHQLHSSIPGTDDLRANGSASPREWSPLTTCGSLASSSSTFPASTRDSSY